jgi:acyl carrier protein
LPITQPDQGEDRVTPIEPTEEQVLTAIRDELAAIKVPGYEAAGMQTEWRDLDVDSLDLVELVTALEDRYGVKIADGELKAILGVGDAVRLVQRLSVEGAPA